MTTARTKAKRDVISTDVNLNPVIKGDKDAQELIASLAQFNKDKQTFEVNVGGTTKSIAALSKEDIEKLQPKNQELNINTIAQNTLGLTDILRNSFNMLLQTMMPQIIQGLEWLSELVLKGVNFISGFLGGKKNLDGSTNSDVVAGQKAKKRVGVVGGATAGALIGGSIGTALIPIPVLGTLIGAALGGALGGLGGHLLTSNANDAIYDGKTGTVTKLNSKDQIVAMKQGGALSQANSPVASAVFGNAIGASSPMVSNISNSKTNNLYSGASEGRSGVYNSNSGSSNLNNQNRNLSGDVKLDLQGTINLVGGGSATKISATELVKDRNFVRELARIIGNQMNRDANGGKYSGGLNNNSF